MHTEMKINLDSLKFSGRDLVRNPWTAQSRIKIMLKMMGIIKASSGMSQYSSTSWSFVRKTYT